jgi:hypothetical protein
MKAVAIITLAVGASANCPLKNYTCCSVWDFFIPVGQACIENEPSSGFFHPGKNNCARWGMSPVTWWARLETKEWREHGVCAKDTPTVTRADIEKKERHDAAFKANFTYWCYQNHAGCTAHQTCYYDKVHLSDDGQSQSWSGMVKHMGPVCTCTFPAGREHTDGTGSCVICKNGADGQPAYVQRPKGNPDGPGAEMFGDGDFACALGTAPNSTALSVLV